MSTTHDMEKVNQHASCPPPEQVEGEKEHIQLSRDADDALKFVVEHRVENTMVTEEDSRRLCRKIDLRLMPMVGSRMNAKPRRKADSGYAQLFITCTLNLLDKQALSFSSTFGLKEDNVSEVEWTLW